MSAFGLRVVWYVVLGGLIALSAHLFFGSTIAASAEEALREVVLYDEYLDGAHHISGIVLVASDCYDLSVKALPGERESMRLHFETWEQPYRDCTEEPEPKAFRVVFFAPEQVSVVATLDGVALSTRVVKQ